MNKRSIQIIFIIALICLCLLQPVNCKRKSKSSSASKIQKDQNITPSITRETYSQIKTWEIILFGSISSGIFIFFVILGYIFMAKSYGYFTEQKQEIMQQFKIFELNCLRGDMELNQNEFTQKINKFKNKKWKLQHLKTKNDVQVSTFFEIINIQLNKITNCSCSFKAQGKNQDQGNIFIQGIIEVSSYNIQDIIFYTQFDDLAKSGQLGQCHQCLYSGYQQGQDQMYTGSWKYHGYRYDSQYSGNWKLFNESLPQVPQEPQEPQEGQKVLQK